MDHPGLAPWPFVNRIEYTLLVVPMKVEVMSSGAAEAIGGIAKILGPTVGRALGVFVRTLVGMIFLGLVLVIGSFVYAAGVSALHGLLAALASIAICAVGGVMLSVKRAVTGALSHAIDELDLGPKGVDLLFAHLLDMGGDDPHGERGVAPARVAENLPLAAAEEKLEAAMVAALKAPDEGGGLGGYLRRKILASLLEKIESLTLAEFRSSHQTAGGVDLVVIRDRLGDGIDAGLTAMIQAASRKITTVFVLGLLILCAASSWGIAHLAL